MSAMNSLTRFVALHLEDLPGPALRLLGGGSRTNDRGDVYDPAALAAVVTNNRMGKGFRVTDVARAREAMRDNARSGCRSPRVQPERTELTLPCGLPARRYLPASGRPRAVLVWFHGGGWVVGDLDSADSAAAWLAAEAGVAVVSVAYRLAPEHPWPVPVEDVLASWADVAGLLETWGLTGLPMGVGGDSAGGNLSAVLSLRLRGTPGAPAFQLLVYPGLDLRCQTESSRLFADDPALSATTISQCRALYAADAEHPDASPALADSLEGLPPAVVATCGFDPLRDEGEAYATAMRAAGVAVREVSAPTLPHGFLHLDGVSQAAARAVDDTVAALVDLLENELSAT